MKRSIKYINEHNLFPPLLQPLYNLIIHEIVSTITGIQELQTLLVAPTSTNFFSESSFRRLSRYLDEKSPRFEARNTAANRQPTMRENNRILEISGIERVNPPRKFRVLSRFASTRVWMTRRDDINSGKQRTWMAFWICWFNLETI